MPPGKSGQIFLCSCTLPKVLLVTEAQSNLNACKENYLIIFVFLLLEVAPFLLATVFDRVTLMEGTEDFTAVESKPKAPNSDSLICCVSDPDPDP